MKEPNLDHWTTAFAVIAFLGLFVAPLLLSQAGQRKSQVRYIVGIVVLFSIMLIYYVLFWSEYIRLFPYLIGTIDLFFFLFGPLFYLYLKDLVNEPIAGQKRVLHFLPFFIGLAADLIVLIARTQYPELWSRPARIPIWGVYFKVLPWVYLIQLALYAIAILRLQQSFGSLQKVGRWALWVSLCYLGFVLANWSYFLLVRLPFFNRAWDYGISFSMSGFIALVAVLAYVQPHIFQTNEFPGFESEPKEEPDARYRHSGLPSHLARHFANQLQLLMHTEKLYQHNELRLDTLAERLSISRHHLSQVINEQLGMSFFEYVNSLRVEEAKTLLAQVSRRELNVIEVAYQVGFNNKVSFNKAFKRATGRTPSEFRQSMQAKPKCDPHDQLEDA